MSTEVVSRNLLSSNVLIIAAIAGAENCGRVIAEQLALEVEVATTRRAGLQALRHSLYSVVVVEESLVEADPVWADLVWKHAGLAMPVQVNFGISGSARLAREVRAALVRRDGEHAIARRAAAVELENELKSSVTGLMLESELALREASGSKVLDAKLRHLVVLAATLRARLRSNAEAPHTA